MNEAELRDLLDAVRAGGVSRRAFVGRPVGLGLAASFADLLLARSGLAETSPGAEYKPTRAGAGGALKTLFRQAPTLLNPHFAVGAKDVEVAGSFTSR
jgi:peptide/nickel transport system substrate-binding protein